MNAKLKKLMDTIKQEIIDYKQLQEIIPDAFVASVEEVSPDEQHPGMPKYKITLNIDIFETIVYYVYIKKE